MEQVRHIEEDEGTTTEPDIPPVAVAELGERCDRRTVTIAQHNKGAQRGADEGSEAENWTDVDSPSACYSGRDGGQGETR